MQHHSLLHYYMVATIDYQEAEHQLNIKEALRKYLLFLIPNSYKARESSLPTEDDIGVPSSVQSCPSEQLAV